MSAESNEIKFAGWAPYVIVIEFQVLIFLCFAQNSAKCCIIFPKRSIFRTHCKSCVRQELSISYIQPNPRSKIP